MAETHPVEVLDFPRRFVKRNAKRNFTYPEARPAANLFKFISDTIWADRPESSGLTCWSLPSKLHPQDALQAVNEVASSVDQTLVLADGKKDLHLRGGRSGNEVTIPAGSLASPHSVSLETFNWDDDHHTIPITIDGETYTGRFTDGHRSYSRELGVGFNFFPEEPEPARLVISYLMQRDQRRQHQPTGLHVQALYSEFAETGYEGNLIHSVEITDAQEDSILKAMASIGGISLSGAEQARSS